jgi:hypothetical protein
VWQDPRRGRQRLEFGMRETEGWSSLVLVLWWNAAIRVCTGSHSKQRQTSVAASGKREERGVGGRGGLASCSLGSGVGDLALWRVGLHRRPRRCQTLSTTSGVQKRVKGRDGEGAMGGSSVEGGSPEYPRTAARSNSVTGDARGARLSAFPPVSFLSFPLFHLHASSLGSRTSPLTLGTPK